MRAPTCAPATGAGPTRRRRRSSTAGSAPAISPCDPSDGYITLRGRRSDLIISGGFNIYPREIEELLVEHPAVAEAAVVGVADRVRGEVPMGFVVRAAGANASEADLIDFCRAKLASFKVPRAIRFVDRLPRTALGKIQKAALVKGL